MKKQKDAEPTKDQPGQEVAVKEANQFYEIASAAEYEISRAFYQQFQFPGSGRETILIAIRLKKGSTVLSGFELGGGVTRGRLLQGDLEQFIQTYRRKLSLPELKITKPRPDAGLPGVEWCLDIEA